MKEVVVARGQTILDICLQEAGSLDAMFALCDLNNIMPDDVLAPGQIIKVPEPSGSGLDVAIQLGMSGKYVNTQLGAEMPNDVPGDQPTGINHWAIEVDFIVQPNS